MSLFTTQSDDLLNLKKETFWINVLTSSFSNISAPNWGSSELGLKKVLKI